MCPQAQPDRPTGSFRLLYAALALVLVFLVVGAFLPDKRVWGFNHLAFYPAPVRLIAILLVALSFVPRIARSIHGRLVDIAGFLARATGRDSIRLPAVCAAAFIIFLVFQSSTLLLGDGIYTATNIELGIQQRIGIGEYARYVTPTEKIYPATNLLNYVSGYTAAKLFGADAVTGVRVVNAAIGALFVLVILLYVRRSRQDTTLKTLTVLTILTSGTVQLFFGYVEYYTPLALLATLYVLFAWRSLSERGDLWRAGVVLLAAVAFHVGAVLLVPSFIFVVLWATQQERIARRLNTVVWSLAVVVLLALIVMSLATGLARHFLPLRTDDHAYGILSAAHFADMFNAVVLILPGFLVFVAMMVVGRGTGSNRKAHGERADAEAAFAWCAFVPAVLFLLTFLPELGMARDWDLFTLAAPGFLVSAFVVLKRFLDNPAAPKDLAPFAVPAVVMSLVLTAAWIGINASPSRSVDRYKSILNYDKTHAGYAYESLAKFYGDQNDLEQKMSATEKAYEHTQNPRYLFQMCKIYAERGDSLNAIGGLYEVLERSPDMDVARVTLVGLLNARGDAPALIRACREGIMRTPDDPFYHYFLGVALLRLGALKEGLDAFKACLARNPTEVMVNEMYQVIRDTPGLSERIIQAVPDPQRKP